jgi:hypothetical protein
VCAANLAEIKTKAGGGFFVVKISPKNAKLTIIMFFSALIFSFCNFLVYFFRDRI